jgi:hypothetical protein
LGTSSSVSSSIPAPSIGKSIKGNADGTGWVATTNDPDEQVALATAQAVIATAQAGTATTQAGIATTKAGEANASAIAAAESAASVPTMATILATMMPVGFCVDFYGVSTNPATIYGFGTWTAIEGLVTVGYKSGDANFGTAGAAVGAASVTLTAAQSGVGSHNHRLWSSNGSSADCDGFGNASSDHGVGGMAADTGTDGYYNVDSEGSVLVEASSAAASEAHTNIQPSLVVYKWRRTA